MSDVFYNTLLPKINQTVERFGTTYNVEGDRLYDADTMTTLEPIKRSVQGLVSDGQLFNGLGGATQNPNRDASNISWVGKRVLILSPSANIKPGERVQFEGKWYPFSNINELKPANITLLYILDVTV